MRIGSRTRSLARLMACMATLTVTAAAPLGVRGQAPPNYQAMDPYCGGGAMGPAGCYGDGSCYGDPYGHGGGPMPRPGFTGPMPMGNGGTNPPIGYDLMNDVGMEGFLIDQRGPHYFDVRAEGVYLTRDETFGPNVDFTSNDVDDVGPPEIVLFSDQLEYDYEPGFRIVGRYDVCPLSVIEFGYTGVFDFHDEQSFTATPPVFLYTTFSDFGLNPTSVTDVSPNNPMPQTEQALSQSISIESDLQSAEISWRRYWLGWSPRISGTLLAGFRYTRLDEDFVFSSQGSQPPLEDPASLENAALQYSIDANNSLYGFQTGADIWAGLMQGLRIGAEGKAGIYANNYALTNQITTSPGVTSPTMFEPFGDTQPALIAEASADVVADILPSVSLRAGYEVLFINSIVLSGDNFNQGSPYNRGPISNGNGPLRVPFINDQGEALYHGGHAGIEIIW